MICNKCGAENDDGVKYCSTCGNRLDGKKECPFCHAEIKETSVYCANCGKRVDGKKLCPVCGNEMGENDKFCNACGYGNKSVTKQRDSQIGFASKTEKVLFYIKNGLALLAMLFAFVGAFVIGLGLTGGTHSEIINHYKTLTNPFKGIMMAFQILAIVGTAVMIILASIFLFAKKKNVLKYSLTSLILLLLPIAVLLSQYVFKIDGESIYLSDATLAMMILCFIFVTATLVLCCVENALKDKKSLLPNCFGTATVLLICVAILSFGFTAIILKSLSYDDDSFNVVSSGILSVFSENTLEKLGLSFLVTGLVVTAVCGIFKAFGFDKTSLSLGFVGLAFQIASLVCMFYGYYNILEKTATSEYLLEVSAGYIVGIVISAIACGLNITHTVLKKKAKNNGLDARLQ